MSYRILIADNDPYYHCMYLNYFENMNCEITSVKDGKEALLLLLENAYNLAIIDANLAGYKGIDIVSALHENDSLTPVIVVSGDETAEMERTVRGVAPAYYFIKPFEMSDMMMVACTLLSLTSNVNSSIFFESAATAQTLLQ